MYPIDAGGDFGHLVVIAENHPDYLPLPIRLPDASDPQGVMITRWAFSDEERKAVAAGADLMLRVLTFRHPIQPMALWIAGHDPEKFMTPPEGENDPHESQG